MSYHRLLLFLTVLWTGQAMAQVTADAEFRFNPVYSRGFRVPLYSGDQPGFYTMQRTRLILNYQSQDDLDMEMVIQDRRFWGDQNERADVPNMAIFRAWIEKYFAPGLSVKLGRQGLIYDDQYLFGEMNWGGTLAHDAALLKYETDWGKIHLGGAFNSNGGELHREHYEYNMYKSLQYLWFHKDMGALSTSLIFVNHGDESADTTVHYTQTFGTNSSLQLSDNLTLKGIYYHQVGENSGSKKVNAHFFSAQVLYKMNKSLSFNVGADVCSGTKESQLTNVDNNKSNTFDRYFGLPHGKFGYLDYFYVKNKTEQGVRDFYYKTKVKAGKWTISNDIHAFESDKSLLNAEGTSNINKFLGIENDLKVGVKLSSTFSATLGHSFMFGTDSFEEYYGGQSIRDSQFFYAVITARPRLFESKN